MGALLLGVGPNREVMLVGVLCLVLSAFCLYFFRDPPRAIVVDEKLITSPGDGRVLGVEPIEEGPFKGGRVVRIFLSIFDVHVQRAPITGNIKEISYKKGRFLDARNPRAHLENEQNCVTFENPRGKVQVKQIAGLIARRIVCTVKAGTDLKQGDRYGLIRFGSQVDIILPPTARVQVTKGDRAIGGKTVVAQWE